MRLEHDRELPMNREMHPHPSAAYLRLAEGPDDLLGAELSLTRRLTTLFVAFVLFSGTSLFATAALDLDHGLIGKALAANAKASHDGEDDNAGPGGGDDDDDEADDNGNNVADTNNAVTGGGASHSDDNGDGDSDSSEHQRAQRVKADDSNSDQNGDGQTDSSRGQQVTDSNSDDNGNGNSDSSKRQVSDDSNSDDNHDGNTDSSRGASVSFRSQATSDGRGDHTRG
jgi:hypothetical protein